MAAFEIDGRDYPVPSVFTMTMGEAQVLYDYSGYTLEDFVPPLPDEPDTRIAKLKDPAFKRAMVHIAFQRGNPDTSPDEVRQLVDGVQMMDMTVAMFGDENEDPTPGSQKQPEPKSSPYDLSSTEGSGSRSDSTSDEPAVTLVPTGTTG